MPETVTLKEILSHHVKEGILYEKLPQKELRCFSCGHRCLIREGRDGICRVRFNRDGVLYVPTGYVGALQCDPIEKKPFFHALPGTDALSFGMLGCDFHCGYCITPSITITTQEGAIAISELFSKAQIVSQVNGDSIAHLKNLSVYTHTGDIHPVRALFKHKYRGDILEIQTYCGPSLELTPDHEVLAFRREKDIVSKSSFLSARQLTPNHYLAIPKNCGWKTSSQNGYLLEDENYFYIKVKEIISKSFNDYVYNMEVENDHSYLASCIATHNCQNWITSQAIRDPNAMAPPQYCTPEELVRLAKKYHAPVLASTYNEPLITSEWAVEVFQAAKKAGLKCAYISNGNGTPEALQYIRPWVDLYKVDLKSFNDQNYRQLGGVLQVVLETIERLKAMGFWVEIVTLTIPGFNDSDEELTRIAKFLVSVSPEIPWHVTAFHKDYKMTDPENTSAKTLIRAAKIGEAAGLQFIYAGNLPGQVDRYENTYCPGCKTLLIERYGYTIRQDLLTPKGICPKCHQKIPGVWN